ncbi:hypothetical protein LUZ63_013214 [Rhynchospora breviuscula]|uniref:Aminotransferase-like plant mobile domain-containing protein n=1 Tax=Rhynchospora breviuscula TaxID=2022672 RepID=A0A9Q0C8G8_9POAL|nr:hypothetical protein LUZ63_013214 [Rhynchospora breviuscula]
MGRSEEVDQRLMTLGLIHFTELGHMPLDRSMIQGLAMFWRPETHTFHFSRVGEMTVDLEDVGFILGLSTTGLPVTGRTDYDDVLLLADLALPRDTPMDDDVSSGHSVKYNWGAATLAMLYRGLDNAAMGKGGQKIAALWVLVQLWSYARLLVCRQSVTKTFKGWGLPSADRCPPYGSGIEYARDVLLKMDHGHVVWRPYDEVSQVVMPPYARLPMRIYCLRVPCIYYWVVAWQHADRVMHQFMLYQTVPPPIPTVWRRVEQLLQYTHTTFRGSDWRDLFSAKVAMWIDTTQVEVAEMRAWSDGVLPSYDGWMRVHGGAHLVPIPGAAEQIPARELTYLQEAPHRVKHILTKALRACAWAVKKGCRRAGKQLLKSCSTQLDLVGEHHRLPHLLEVKGLPTDIDSIPDSSEEDHMPELGFEEQQFMRPSDYSLHDWDTYFDQPRPSQPIVRSRRGDPASEGLPTPPGPPPRPPPYYEYGTQYPQY